VTEEIKFVIVILHHPPFTSLARGDKKNLKEKIVPLLEKHHVDAVFSGHAHNYERLFFDDIHYIVTGGGAPLHDRSATSPYSHAFRDAHHFCRLYTEEDDLVIEALDKDMNVFARVRIHRKK